MATWPKPTSQHANSTSDQYKQNLRAVAEAFAEQERVDSVSKKHVDDAHSALARVGLNTKPFFFRGEFWTAFAGFCLGASISMPDLTGAVVSSVGGSEELKASSAVAGFVLLVIIGFGVYLFTLIQNSLPTEGWKKFILPVIVVALVVSGAAFVCSCKTGCECNEVLGEPTPATKIVE